tara:strand:- start:590 stop:799 length:210 start_codon:yes stop_codon:yes gene_type:complete
MVAVAECYIGLVELLLIAFGIMVGGYLIMVIVDYLKKLDNLYANLIFGFVLLAVFFAFLIWSVSSSFDS